MDRYAVVDTTTNVVINTVVWDGKSEWVAPEGCIAVETDEASIGWLYSDNTFTKPMQEQTV